VEWFDLDAEEHLVERRRNHSQNGSTMTFDDFLERLRERVFPLSRFVHAFAGSLPQPTMQNNEHGYRYEQPDYRHFCLLRAARIVSALNASVELTNVCYPQEIGVLIRIIHEFMRQIEAVVTQIERDGNVSGPLREFIATYFEDGTRSDSPRKRTILSEKYVNELIGESLDEFGNTTEPTWKPTADRLHHVSSAHANYVHARYPESMDLYGGRPGHFHLSGMRNTPKDGENCAMLDAVITSTSLCFIRLVQGLNLRRLLDQDPALVRWFLSRGETR
jgi:hypothetical protein